MPEREGPASALDYDESSVLEEECGYKLRADSFPIYGTLFLTTADRIVFVESSGTFKKSYDKRHFYNLRSITNVRIEKGPWGTSATLVVERNDEGASYSYRYDRLDPPTTWRQKILEKIEQARTLARLTGECSALLVSQENTSFDELQDILRKGGLNPTDKLVVQILQKLLQEKSITGFVEKDKRIFIHTTAYKREVVQYSIASSFTFDENGVLQINCPNCHAPNQQADKSTSVKCLHCGTSYTVPQKILGLL
jgi:ribosomal protein S27E